MSFLVSLLSTLSTQLSYGQLIPPSQINARVLDARAVYCTDTGSTDTYACNLSPAPTSYVIGATYRFKANTVNTGAATINFNSLGAKTIKKYAGGAALDLADNDIRAGQIVEVSYDGTNMQMLSTLGTGAGGGGTPGGSNTQCQFNDGGAFGGDAGCTYDKTSDVLTLLGGVVAGNCTTNCLTHDTSAITGSKTATWPNKSGTVLFQNDQYGYWDAWATSPDGTNCTVTTDQTLNTGPLTGAFSCADSTSSIFYGKMRLKYALATATFTLAVFHGTTESITFGGDVSAMCRADGTTVDATWGTAVALDVAITTANRTEQQTSAAVTPNGTCSAGAMLFWRYVVSATRFSTNAVNTKVLGMAMEQAS